MAKERDTETESGEAEVDEEGRNPTQQRMDEEGVEPAPVDASREGEDGSGAAAASPETNEPIFEPDVPLVAEVNREAGAKSRKGLVAAVAGGFALIGAALLRRRR